MAVGPYNGMPSGAIAPKSGSDTSYVYKVLLKSGKYKYFYPEDIAKMKNAQKNATTNASGPAKSFSGKFSTSSKSSNTGSFAGRLSKAKSLTNAKSQALTTANVTPKSSTKTGGVVPERSLNPGETVNISDAGVGTKDAKEAGERVQAQKEAEKNSLWGRISSAANDVKTFFTGAYNTVKTAVSTALGSVKTFASTFIDEKLKPAWQTVSGTISKGFGAVQTKFQEIGKGIENIWNYLTGNEARAAIGRASEEGGTEGRMKAYEAQEEYNKNTLPGQIGSLIGSIGNTIRANRVTSAAKSKMNDAKNTMDEAYREFINAASGGSDRSSIEAANKRYQDAYAEYTKASSNYESKHSATKDTPIGKVTDAIDTAVSAVTDTAGKAMSVLKDAYKVARNFFGNDIPEYLTTAFNTVTGAASEGWSTALGAITSWFNFASANPNVGGEGSGDNANPQLQHGVSFDSVRYAVQHSDSMPTLNDIDHAFFGGSLGTSWLVGPGVGLNAG